MTDRPMRIPLEVKQQIPDFVTNKNMNKAIGEVVLIMSKELDEIECAKILSTARILVMRKS